MGDHAFNTVQFHDDFPSPKFLNALSMSDFVKNKLAPHLQAHCIWLIKVTVCQQTFFGGVVLLFTEDLPSLGYDK